MKNENDVQGVPPSGSGSAVVPSRDATPSGTSDPSRGVERPILFSGPMVRALLEGRKTQTRRIVKSHGKDSFGTYTAQPLILGESFHDRFRCPYGKPGDRLWVRETHYVERIGYPDGKGGFLGRHILYRATDDPAPVSRWTPSLHMPRWASRITLEVVSVRVERLQDISEEDARAEGLTCLSKDGGITYKWGIPDRDGLPGNDDDGWPWQEWTLTAKEAFLKLFARIYGQEVADANPWLWAVSYRDRDAEGLRPKDRANSEPVAARADEGGIAHTNT